VILLRPSIICIIDDLEATEPSEYQWLMHANDKLSLNQEAQSFAQQRKGLVMTTKMFATDELQFSQTDEWPVDPRTGYPESLENPPEKLWHFKASSSSRMKRFRMATVMVVERSGKPVGATITTQGDETIKVEFQSDGAQTALKIYLSREAENILDVISVLSNGKRQTFAKP